MKKTILAIGICACLASCNSRDNVYSCEAFGNIDEGGTIMTDDGFKQFPINAEAINGARVGLRVHYLYNVKQSDSVHVELIGIEAALAKNVIPVSEIVTDTLGDRSIQVSRFALYSGGYMNVHVSFGYIPQSNCEEIINMTVDDVNDHGDTLVLALRHKRYIPASDKVFADFPESNTSTGYGVASFPIWKYLEPAKKAGKTSVPVKIHNTTVSGKIYAIEGSIPTDTFIQPTIRN